MSSCQPLTVRHLPRAALTLLLATVWSVVSRGDPNGERRRRRRVAGYGAVTFAVFFVLAAMVSTSMTLVWLAAGLLAGAAVVCYLASAVVLLRAIYRSDSWAWTDGSPTLIATARLAGPKALNVSNLAGWPVGRGRAKPFLADLCTIADQESWTLIGRAGDRYLLDRLYTPLGFVTTDEPNAKRPTIRRDPGSPTTL